MMKKTHYLFVFALLLLGCQKKSEISQNLNCSNDGFQNLENITDFHQTFSVKIPKTWKTNLYFDETLSSIYTADTTRQLTQTLLWDATLIKNKINFNANFKLKHQKNHIEKNLIQVEAREVLLLEKPTFYSLWKGTKGKYKYQISTVFIKINDQKYLTIKNEVYGDSLVKERLCKGIRLIDQIKILKE